MEFQGEAVTRLITSRAVEDIERAEDERALRMLDASYESLHPPALDHGEMLAMRRRIELDVVRAFGLPEDVIRQSESRAQQAEHELEMLRHQAMMLAERSPPLIVFKLNDDGSESIKEELEKWKATSTMQLLPEHRSETEAEPEAERFRPGRVIDIEG
jgi:hypothetical protein